MELPLCSYLCFYIAYKCNGSRFEPAFIVLVTSESAQSNFRITSDMNENVGPTSYWAQS